jgi:hypothetical protein
MRPTCASAGDADMIDSTEAAIAAFHPTAHKTPGGDPGLNKAVTRTRTSNDQNR